MKLEKSLKWSDTSDIKIPDLKVLSKKVFMRKWSVVVISFLVTLAGLFMVGIIPFWYNLLKKSCTFLQFSWSKILKLKPPAIWYILLEILVLLKNKVSNGSIRPFVSLYKTLNKILLTQVLHKGISRPCN